jgi:hypothetical protein
MDNVQKTNNGTREFSFYIDIQLDNINEYATKAARRHKFPKRITCFNMS